MAANLIVTRTTSFFNDQDEGGIFDWGDTLYTRVTITNNGDANATDVTFEDNFAGTTMVAGTLNISPIAFNDSYTAVANTVLRVGTGNTIGGGESTFVAGNLLTNDRGSGTVGTGTITGDSITGFQIDPFSGNTLKGGTYNIYSDGTFNYVNDGNDTEVELSAGDFFTYTIRDAGLDNTYNTADDLTSTATVTITFSTQSGVPGTAVNRVWYVDGSKNTDGTGTSANPFQSSQITSKLSSGGDVDAAGHYIYVENTASGSIALEADQKLIGTGEGLSVGGFGITGDGGGNSVLNATSGFAVTLSTGNIIAGINLGGTGGISGTGFGTLTVTDDVVLNTSGAALSLSTGAFAGTGFAATSSSGGASNVSLTDVTGTIALGSSGALSGATGDSFFVSGSASGTNITYGGTIGHANASGALVNVQGGHTGTITFTGALSATNGTGLQFNNADGTYNFNGNTTVAGGNAGVDILNNSSGTFNFGIAGSTTTAITGPGSGASFVIDTSDAAVTYNGNITQATNWALLDINGHGGGKTVTFQNGTLSATNGTGLQFSNADGTYNFNGTTTLNGGDAGIDIDTGSAGAFSFNSNTTITNPTGTAFNVDGGNGNITYDGTITDDVGQAVRITNRTGGTIDFNGLITDNFDGDGGTGLTEGSIHLGTNTAGTVRFDGGIHLSTGANDAFTAIGNIGSTLIITDPASTMNRITTTTGTALDVQNTTIGNTALVFESINSTGATVNVGINLNNTGTGGLTITGTGLADTGGTISNKTGVGITLTDTGPVSLTDFNVSASGDDGIRGSNVNGFTLTRVDIANNGNAVGERGVDMTNLRGSVTIANSNFTGSGEDGLYIRTNQTMTMTVTASTFTTNNDSFGNDGLIIIGYGNAAIVASITGSTFTDNRGDHFQYSTETAAGTVPTADITFSGNTLRNPQGSATVGGGPTVGGGITINPGGSSNTNVNIANNSILDSVLSAITLRINTDSTASALFEATVTGNTIGASGDTYSGSHQAYGIDITASGSGTLTANVAGNTIHESTDYAMHIEGNDGNGVINLTVTGNTLVPNQTDPNFAREAIRINMGSASVNVFGQADSHTLRLDLGGPGALANTLDGGPNGFAGAHDYLIRQRFNTRVELEGFNNGGNAFNAAAVISYINGRNTLVTGTGHADANNSVTTVTDGYHNVAAVPMPSLPATPILAAAPPPADEPIDGGLVDDPQVDNDDGGTGDGEVSNDQHGDPVPADDEGGDTGPAVVDDGVLSQAELDLVVEAAIARWIAAGATPEQVAAMRAAEIKVADLTGLKLAESTGGTITLDGDAAGWRWFVDSTPDSDEEYAGSGTVLGANGSDPHAETRIDLLTVIMHELGHQIGLLDTYAAGETDELMHGTIRAGERRLPGSDDLQYAQDGPVAGAFAISPINLGTLEPGRIVTIEWRHTIDNPGEDRLVGSWTGQSLVDSTETAPQLSNAESGNVDALALGDLIYNDVNKNGLFDAGDTAAPNVVVTLYADTNNSGAYEEGTDLYIGYTEVNGTPGYQQGVDTPAAPGTGTPLTATTNASGLYSFSSLAPGDYIVRVNASNFQAGGALFGKTSHGTPADPNAGFVNNDNNGEQFLTGQPGTYAASRAIRLDYGLENVAGPTGTALDTNDTLDLAFELPNQPPAIAALQGDAATFIEGGTAVKIDQGTLASITDSDSPNFNLGSLTVAISGNKDASEDELGIDTAAATGVTIATGTISVDGFAIGTVTGGGAGGGDIVVTFNTNDATPARVAKLLNALTYFNSDGVAPSTAQRTVSITLVDGDGEANGGDDDTTVTTLVNVTAVNDEPAGADNIGSLTTPEDTRLILSAANFGFTDQDGNAFAGVVVTTTPGMGTLYIDTDGAGGTLGTAVSAGNFVDIADINAGRLVYVPAANQSGNDTFTFQVRDNGGTSNGGIDTDGSANTIGIAVTAANDAPVLDLNGAAAGDGATNGAYEQDAAGTGGVAPDATVTDVDSANFDTGTLTVEITANGQAGDVLQVVNFTDNGGNTVTVAGADISYNGTVVATYTAGDHDTPLVITFDADATPTAAQWVTRAVNFVHNSDNPTTATRSLTYTLTDGDGGSDSAVASVNVTQENDAPVLSDPTNATLTYSEGAAAIALMQGVTLSDADLPSDFAGGSLTLGVSGTGGAIDFKPLSLFSVSAGSLVYDDAGTPVTMGSISGIGTNSVSIDFNANATLARLNDLVDDFVYSNATDDIGDADRTATLTFNDGNNDGNIVFSTALSDTAIQTIDITAVNDAPTIDLNGAAAGTGNAAAFTEDGAAEILAPDLVVADADDTMIESAAVSIGAGFIASADSLTIGGLASGTTGTGGAIAFNYVAATGILTLTGSASIADYQAALRQVAFDSTSQSPGTSRAIGWTVNDGSLDSAAQTTTLTVTPVNDAPAGADNSVATTEDDAYTFSAGDFGFSDTDGHVLESVQITELPATGELRLNNVAVTDDQVILAADIPNLKFHPVADQFASPYATFKFKVTDTGGTDNGGADTSGEYTMTVNVLPDNLAPVVDLNGADAGIDYATSYSEGASPIAIGSGITVSDPDSGVGDQIESATITITDPVAGDALTLAGPLPLGVTVDPSSTATMLKLVGAASQAEYQAALALVRYASSSENPAVSGTDAGRTITVVVNDGSVNSATATATVDITATNDGPVNSVPGAQSAVEDTDKIFSAATGNAITVADADAASGDMSVTLAVGSGRLTLATTAGLAVTGDGTATVTLSGSQTAINAALDGLKYRGNLNFEGADTLTILTSDNGLSGDGGAKTDTDQVAINVADDGLIHGDSGDNVLNGTPAPDQFRVQQGGNDTVNGLGNSDAFYFGNAFTAGDTVNGGDGVDVLILQGDYSAGVTFGTGTTSNISSVGIISLVPGNLTTYGDTAGNSYSYNLTMLDSNLDALAVLKFNAFHLRAGENFTFNGAAETNGTYLLMAGLGVDSLTGGGAGDTFYFGHDGRFGAGDTVNGGGGSDILYLRGDYTIDFNAVGFAGSISNVESIGLMSTTDTSIGGGGDGEFDYSITWNDAMLAVGGVITINGSRLTAEESMVFDGSAEMGGIFRLFGGGGNDVLIGGSGADLIYGSGRGDTLTGGGGNDVFRYQSVTDSNSTERDSIQDFNAGDKIDLSRIDADILTAGDQAFSFIGNAAFSNKAGELRYENISLGGTTWLVQGDIDGDSVSDFEVVLVINPVDPITASDFIL